jgi:cobalt/nickel transport system permease protein
VRGRSSVRRELLSAAEAGPAARPGLGAIDPRVRIIVAMLFAVAIVAVESLAILAVCLALSLALVAAARLPPGPTLSRVAALDLFIVFSVLLLPFTMPGNELARFGPFVVSREGSLAAVTILFKATAVILALVSLVGTMEAVDLGHALARLAVPAKLIALLFFTVRYIEVLHRELGRLRLAMKARAFTMRTDLHTWRALGFLLGMLFVRSFERAERILKAMKCRAFTGTFHGRSGAAPGLRDLVFAAVAAFVLAALVGIDRS